MAPGEIVFIRGANKGRFPNAHCLFIDDEVPTVVDPASRPEELERLDREKGIRLVINSHYHVDHVRYNGLFPNLSLIHISEPTRLGMISYAVFCLKKKKI